MFFKISSYLFRKLSVFATDEQQKPSVSPKNKLLILTKILIWFPSKVSCISYQWNNDQKRFVSLNEQKRGSKTKWNCFHFVLFLLILYLMGELGQLLSGLTQERNLVQTLMGMMTIIAMGGSTFGRFMYSRNALSFTNCFNNINKYLCESKECSCTSFSGRRYNFLILLFLGMTANQILLPLVVFVAAIYFPCLTNLLGYSYLHECMINDHKVSNGEIDILIATIVILSYILACVLTCAGSLVDIAIGLIENAFLLSQCLVLYKKKVLRGIQRSTVPADYSSRSLQNNISEYRQIQLLTTLYNEVNQNYLIVGYAVMIIAFQILSLYVCISLSNRIPGVFTLIFFICAVNLVPLTFCMFSYVAAIFESSLDSKYTISQTFSSNIVSISSQSGAGYYARRWCRLFFRSCRPVRSEFGPFYFVDSCIPLEFESFAIEQTVSFLLMG